jgi:hypothetical protein
MTRSVDSKITASSRKFGKCLKRYTSKYLAFCNQPNVLKKKGKSRFSKSDVQPSTWKKSDSESWNKKPETIASHWLRKKNYYTGHEGLKARLHGAIFSATNLSRNGVATQVARSIAACNLRRNLNKCCETSCSTRCEKKNSFLLLATIAATCVNVAPCRHFCSLCRNAIAKQVAEEIAPCISP